jgi:hypothetical protein
MFHCPNPYWKNSTFISRKALILALMKRRHFVAESLLSLRVSHNQLPESIYQGS